MLSFNVNLALDGEPLTNAERKALQMELMQSLGIYVDYYKYYLPQSMQEQLGQYMKNKQAEMVAEEKERANWPLYKRVFAKYNDIAAVNGDKPNLHHIYVRSLTEATHGNASGIGLAQMCHRRVVDAIDREVTRNNCITACHVSAGAIPLDFPNDREALKIACDMAGYIQPSQLTAMWIRDTLSLDEVECSEAFFNAAKDNSQLEIIAPPSPLQFDANGDLVARF